MDKEYLFSIIIPVYNSQKYLPECLESILNQTYNEEYELIIINDGSTDDSLNIINSYKEKFKDCKVIDRNSNRGVLYTKVEGVKKAIGEYVLFLDSDDYLPKDTLEFYKNEISEEYDIIRGNYYTDNEGIINEVYDFKNSYIIKCNEFKEKYFIDLLTSNKFNSASKQIIKRNIINVDSIKDTSICMGDDIEFNLSCYSNVTKNVKIVNHFLYYYRKNFNSITNDFSEERLKNNIIDINKVYNSIFKYISTYCDDKILKLYYSSYLKLMNYYCYMLVDKCNNKKIIEELSDIVLNDKKLIEAKKILKYRDISFKKIRFLLYLLMNKKKGIYFFSLKILSKLNVKYNH